MIYNTLEQAQAAQKAHFEKDRLRRAEEERRRLNSYYVITKALYSIRETIDGKFEYPEDGIYRGDYAEPIQ